MESTLASIPEEVSKRFRAFKLNNSHKTCAIISKINSQTRDIEIEEELSDISFDYLPDDLTTNEPRYVLLSYEHRHNDGRVSYPYCLVFSSPRGSPPPLKMLYAGSLHHFVNASQVTKVFELQDLDDFNEEWVKAQMLAKRFC